MTPRKPNPPSDALADLTATVEAMKREQTKIKADVAAAARLVADAETMRVQTFKMVTDMHRALMEPQLGQGDKTMVERIAEVVVDIESGRRTSDNLIAIARRLVAIAAFVAAIAAFLKLGVIPRE